MDWEQLELLTARAVAAGAGTELDAAVSALRTAPTADPSGRSRRAGLAAQVILALVRADPGKPVAGLRHLDELVAMVDAAPAPGPHWPRLRAAARALGMLHAAAEGTLPDPGAALRELDELQPTADEDPAIRALFESARMGLRVARSLGAGDPAGFHQLRADLATFGELLPDGAPTAQAMAHIMGPLMRAAQALADAQDEGPEAMWQAARAFQAEVALLPPDHPLRSAADDAIARMEPLLSGAGTVPQAPGDAHGRALDSMLAEPGSNDAQIMNLLAAGGAALGGGTETRLDRIDAAIASFRRAVALAPTGHPQRAMCLQSVAMALYRRTEVTGDVADLAGGVELLEEARGLLGGPHHPQWPLVNELLGGLRQRLGRKEPAWQPGLDAQQSYAWQALLQAGSAEARRTIRRAAGDAVELARRCLSDHNAAAAIRALDTGRGLMLFAANERRRIPEHLERAGHPELARDWVAADSTGVADQELRRALLTVLAAQPDSAARLLDPPGLPEIQHALRTVDADALVYLMAGERPTPGWAVVAPVDGSARYLALPNLDVEDAEVKRYLHALERYGRGRDLADDVDSGEIAASLDQLCAWAWNAAVGPLIEQFVQARPRPADGRAPRLFLVPMGDLALVPWPAARKGSGPYAVELVAFSQIASARMLCDVASRAPVPLSPIGLVVGDPDTGNPRDDLPGARREAYAVWRAFYSGGRYVGRVPTGPPSPSGAGTADQVRRWLTDPDPAAGPMLHLACHGVFRSGQEDARSLLLLARGAGGSRGTELNAEELVGLMAGAERREVGLVVLAACNTGRSMYGYDEAYSLGTAFLAGGARTVLSTRWSVPDAETSSLMFMFHYYLRRERRPAWDALHRAQRWMLDPDRQPPAEMPADLRAAAADQAEVLAWAGFVHWGQ